LTQNPAGYGNPDWMSKDPDLDCLPDNPEFRRLVGWIEALTRHLKHKGPYNRLGRLLFGFRAYRRQSGQNPIFPVMSGWPVIRPRRRK